jgi:hypothetical protein
MAKVSPHGYVSQLAGKDAFDEHGNAIAAMIKFTVDGTILLQWATILFNSEDHPMPDEVRAELVRVLRQHADGLESHDIDRRTKEIESFIRSKGGAS